MCKVTFCAYCRVEYDEDADSSYYGYCSEECMYEDEYGYSRKFQKIPTKSDYWENE